MVSPRVKSYGVMVAVFVLGVAAGAGGSYAMVQHRYARIFRNHDPEAWEGRRMNALGRELDLDAAQQEKLREIFSKHRERRAELQKKMFEDCGKPMEQEMSDMDAEIRAVLRPEQQSKWDEIVAHRRERRPFGPPRVHASAP